MIVLLILLLCVSVAMGLSFCKGWFPKGREARPVPYVFTGFFVLLGILDLFFLVDFGLISGAVSLVALVVLVECLLSHAKKTRTRDFCAVSLLVAMVLELTLLQFPSYQLVLSGNKESQTLSFASADISGGDYECNSSSGSVHVYGCDEVCFAFTDLNIPIDTLRIQIKFDDGSVASIAVDASDDSNAAYRTKVATTNIVAGAEDSEYMTLQLSGDVHDLRIRVAGEDEDSSLLLNSIELNVDIPFTVIPLRVLLLVLFSTFLYAIRHSQLLASPYAEKKWLCRCVGVALAIVCIVLSTMICFSELGNSGIVGQLQLQSGNQMTQELVDAFEVGQVSLLKDVPEELIELENPYDRSLRKSGGFTYAWDHVYYNGKYYSYYGIAPVILFFLPYHLLTGYYASSSLSVLFFACVGFVFLMLSYFQIVERWCGTVSIGSVWSGLVVLLSACGIWYSVGRPKFYEIAIASGFMFLTIGVYLLFKSGIGSKNSMIRLLPLIFSSLCFGLAVLSRPTLAVYAVCFVVWILYHCKDGQNAYKKVGKKNKSILEKRPARMWRYLACSFLPIGSLAIVQMLYNYARFGSFLDFGISYSLTINDFTNAEYHSYFVLITLYNFLFAFPRITSTYPFFSNTFDTMNVGGYYYVSDNAAVAGILFLALPIVAYFCYSHKAWQRLGNMPQRVRAISLVALPCAIMPLVIMVSIWESGYAVRYMADFAWELILGSLLLLFYLYKKSSNTTKRHGMELFLGGSAVCAVIVNAFYVIAFSLPQASYPAIAHFFENLVKFWH